MYKRLYSHFDFIVSPRQCDFCKGCRTQYFLMVMLQQIKESSDRVDKFEALLTEVFQEFNCSDHNPLINEISGYYLRPKLTSKQLLLCNKPGAKYKDLNINFRNNVEVV